MITLKVGANLLLEICLTYSANVVGTFVWAGGKANTFSVWSAPRLANAELVILLNPPQGAFCRMSVIDCLKGV